MTKFWVAGSRDIKSNTIELMTDVMSEHIMNDDVIRTGGARGVDRMAEDIAKRILSVEVIPALIPEWKRFGRGAGFRRNIEGVTWADGVLVFWDGQSKGSLHVITNARKQGKLTQTIYI